MKPENEQALRDRIVELEGQISTLRQNYERDTASLSEALDEQRRGPSTAQCWPIKGSESIRADYTYLGRFARATQYGLVLDECETSNAHMEAPPTRLRACRELYTIGKPVPGKDRRRCQVRLDSLFPTSMFGRRGTWNISVTFQPDDPA